MLANSGTESNQSKSTVFLLQAESVVWSFTSFFRYPFLSAKLVCPTSAHIWEVRSRHNSLTSESEVDRETQMDLSALQPPTEPRAE